MSRYAARTTVPCDRTEMEIRTLLMKAGATGFISGIDGKTQAIMCKIHDRRLRFTLTLPDNPQHARSAWRALLLIIKAKLEAVESGITCFEDEFLAHIVLPSGGTVSEHIRPMIAESYETHQMPSRPLLPA